MKKKLIIVILFILTIPINTQAAGTFFVKDYDLLKGTEAFEFWISGVEDGFAWANVVTNNKLYCPPQKLALNKKNLLRILDDYIKNNKSSLDPEFPITSILYLALADVFPCE